MMGKYNTLKPTNFNENHPELKEGEMFLVNGKIEEDWSHPDFESLRYGETAYNTNGVIVEHLKPIFVRLK